MKRTTATEAARREGTSTADAVLGLLSIAPMSGYEMRTVVSQSIGHFWSESFGQIYPALKKLTAEGLVQKKTERGKGQREKNVYSLTKAGRERLEEWVTVPAGVEVPRNELLLKLFFGSHAPVDASRENVRAFVERQERALAVYGEIAREIERKRRDAPQAPYWLMTLSYGHHYSEALVKWGRETLRELDAMEARERRLSRAKRVEKGKR